MNRLVLSILLALLAAPVWSCAPHAAAASAILEAANGHRQAAGLAALSRSPGLDRAAATLACDMARTGVFDHVGSDGSTVMTRIRRQGCRPRIAAENIAWGYPDAARVMDGWMQSDGHRRNLLLGKARQAGAARVEGGGKVWWVMVFAAGC